MKGIVICGPTGVGKTELSIKLAKKLNAVIISADSMQVYKHMNIGTAKIKKAEMQGITHYMLDIVEPDEKYSVGKYEKDVNLLLEKLEKEDKTVLLVGGTGLYIRAITDGFSDLPKENIELREELNKFSNEELYEMLKNLDIAATENIHLNNRKRVIRALEVCKLTGEKFSEVSKRNYKRNNYNFYKFGLERNREELYNRINLRVDKMFNDGLEKEAKFLYDNYRNGITAIQAIGYKELSDYFDKKIDIETAKELIKRDSRRYAKRQFTWFKRDAEIEWFSLGKYSVDEIEKNILKKVKD
ncbi:tRNA (adenosine(37)-N6)-dimethylallyltransferase MiaA [Haliovirga abyssi]|uniref:tRNA dimethylallyltransferase n=1 Tax=Haliovirga abyssi TaxID=2996794 RepID=A0AAU9DZM1_9FUSO|nr:tRNA (adenosine(37)-N6)-dimethylallyltransferase MiaA [Haliovirga abyssi]BDU51020.1 tRNA dimethylallyltransferase [Haliovirga abyssi]